MDTPRVLIIDDEPATHDMMKEVFRPEEYELLFAANGQEGLSVLREAAPTVIILDLNMPVMDGLQFLSEIQLKPSDPYSVIALTGHGDDAAVRACYEAGVSAFIRKPVSMYELRGLVKNAVALKQLSKHIEGTVAELTVANEALRLEVAERKRAENALLKGNEELEQRVQQRTAELTETAEELRRSHRRVVIAQEEIRKAVASQLHGAVQNR